MSERTRQCRLRALALAAISLSVLWAAPRPAFASAITVRDTCGDPGPGRVRCLAQVLVVRSTDALVHPRLARLEMFLHARRRSSDARSAAAVAAAQSPPPPGTPAYLQQAYDLGYLSGGAGSGVTVAVVAAYDDPNAEADLAVYRSTFSLPPCTTANGCFRKVDQNGAGSYPAVDGAWEREISLDLDSVSALCPRCRILLVEANSDSFNDLGAAQRQAAQSGASEISDSWGGVTSSAALADSDQFTFPGIATVAATGDAGYQPPGTYWYPAALSDVTAAGGTTLSPASATGIPSPRGFTESAWSGSGSGCNVTVAKPPWQSDPGCAGRAYDDLSADADPLTGLNVYDADSGGWLMEGGTSAAAPLIAAYYALVGAGATAPAWGYEHRSVLNDPLTGSNGACALLAGYICNATTGYDGPTGVGSISGAVVAGAPGIGGPGPNASYGQRISASGAALQGGVYPNSAQTVCWWQYGLNTAYGRQTHAGEIGSGVVPVTVTGSLVDLRPGTTYHYRLVARNVYGTSYGYDFTLRTSFAGKPTVSGVRMALRAGSTAVLTGWVDPNGAPTSYRFRYGARRPYRHRSATFTLPAGRSRVQVSVIVRGVRADSAYGLTLSASNGAGSACSDRGGLAAGATSGDAPRSSRSRRRSAQ